MAYLDFIADDTFRSLVKDVLEIGKKRKLDSEKKFSKNVIDPFGALFEVAAFDIDHSEWKQFETIRQCQKTLQNHIGELHQKILGSVKGWRDLGVGGNVDLVHAEHKIIAEVKNKYNTVTGAKLADQYYSLERLVTPKASQYKGYTSYFVNILPKKATRYNAPFTPSDKDKGITCAVNENIRLIDGASFYSLVTGDENAIIKLYDALPEVIEHIFQVDYGVAGFSMPDKSEFKEYFIAAYIQ